MAATADEAHDRAMEPTIHTADRPQLLRRATDGRLVAGVCAGLADYFDVDVVVVRVVAAALVLVGGAGLPLYLAAWLLVPDEDMDESIAERLLGDARSQSSWTPARVHQRHRGGDHDAAGS
jgi:phage shock protein PspC (stress-responsive transcriptional regulator)